MPPIPRRAPRFRLATGIAVLAVALAGCAAGPDFVKPVDDAPEDWTRWRSSDAALHGPAGTAEALPSAWWQAFNDPVLDTLAERALAASPDLQTAALHLAQARVQRGMTAAQRGPEVGLSGRVDRQRLSEYGASTRLIDAISNDRDSLVEILSEPFTLYQAGFDASWELDLWGRVRRSVEAADADIAHQQALLDLAWLTLTSDVARTYFELRSTQRQVAIARDDIAALDARIGILEARVEGGLISHLNLEQQRTELAATRAQLPGLVAEEGARINQIALLLGERPGALTALLAPTSAVPPATLPDLALGLPSEVALRRPDIRAAEARLHRSTARIGVARAELYPSIRLGARFGYESYLGGEFSDWGSRTWSIGPSLDLPLFDGGRRRSVVQLRELEQQAAAVDYQKTVLTAWQEIDDTLSAYTAEQQRHAALQQRQASAQAAYRLAQARYDGGAEDFLTVLDSQRVDLLARRELAASEGRLATRYVMVNKAIGNAPAVPDEVRESAGR